MKTNNHMLTTYRMYAVSGSFSFLFLFVCVWQISAQQLAIQWQQCYGGTDAESIESVRQTFDGGYVFASSVYSTDGQVTGSHGLSDFWIVKTTAAGSLQWSHCFGGSGDDGVRSIIQTSDSGYVAVGLTNSSDGDVSFNHGQFDFWVIRLDKNGSLLWQKSLGGTLSEWGYAVTETPAGNFVVAGMAGSHDGDVSHNLGNSDEWVASLQPSGAIDWNANLGGSGGESAVSIVSNTDGSLIVLGETASSNGQVTINHGQDDIWVVKLDTGGNFLWEHSYGGSEHDNATSVIQTSTGGYCISGYTTSNDGDVTGNHGSYDCWIVNTDGVGNILWQKTLGGSSDDFAKGVTEDSLGGFVVTGETWCTDGDITVNYGLSDLWIVRLNPDGSFGWQKNFGGSGFEGGNCIVKSSEGGFLVGAGTASTDHDVTGNHGNWDCWLLKLGHYDGIDENEMDASIIYPNPVEERFIVENEKEKIGLIEISDPVGMRIKSIHTGGGNKIAVDMSGFEPGIYYVSIFGKGVSRSIKKIVKQ